MGSRTVTDQHEVLAELARGGSANRQETSMLVSPGAQVIAWAVRVKSRVARNTYNVRAVVLGDPGFIPVEMGEQMEAVNLAESFLTEGTLAAGTYALMCRVANKNAFYAVP